MAETTAIKNHAALIWSVADLLRGDYKQSEYGKVILPLVVLRRLDCVLEPTKAAVLERHRQLSGKIENLEPVLRTAAEQKFYNTSPPYEIPLIRHFYKYVSPRPLEEIDTEIKALEAEIQELLRAVTE